MNEQEARDDEREASTIGTYYPHPPSVQTREAAASRLGIEPGQIPAPQDVRHEFCGILCALRVPVGEGEQS